MVTLEELARIFQVCTETAYRWARKGHSPPGWRIMNIGAKGDRPTWRAERKVSEVSP